ncbi:MAG: OadG family protein [Eubacteriales bacterium]|nr:OadG family protein [Eubacteriales bacterium]
MENISSALVMVLGMGTVFAGLIMLILLTKLMSVVIGRGKGAEQAKAAPVAAAAPAAGISDRKAFDAAIAAAIATYMGNEPEGLRIHSIKKV